MGFGIEPKDTHKSNLNSLCISPFSIHRIVQLDCLRISAVNYSVVCNKQMTIIHVAEQKPIRIFFFCLSCTFITYNVKLFSHQKQYNSCLFQMGVLGIVPGIIINTFNIQSNRKSICAISFYVSCFYHL